MVIYSDILTVSDLLDAAEALPPLRLQVSGDFAGRSRRIEGVTLRAISALRPPGTPKPQFATYDEHGHWMARLFAIDPSARIKSAINDFRGAEDFHAKTSRKYV